MKAIKFKMKLTKLSSGIITQLRLLDQSCLLQVYCLVIWIGGMASRLQTSIINCLMNRIARVPNVIYLASKLI